MNERLWYWLFGLALSGALTAAIGRTFVEERGPRVLPVLVATAVLLGLVFGWAIDGYVAYVRASAEMRL